jgi:pilus assembly protein CpaC
MHKYSPVTSTATRRVGLLLASLILVLISSAVQAQEMSYKASFKENKESIAINVLVGQSRVINFDRPVGRFSVSNPEIAEAILVTPDQVIVNGKAFGQVNFIAWGQSGGQYLVFDVYVRANLSLIDSQMRALFPKDDIRLSQANGSVVMSGSVRDPKTAAQVQSVVEAAGFKVVNMLQSPVQDAVQVQLQVRVAEVSRNRMRDYGTSFMTGKDGTATYTNSGGGPSNLKDFNTPTNLIESTMSSALNVLFLNNPAGIAAMLRAIRQNGSARILAEPNLIAMNGEQASFLAGGEFPVPVIQGSGSSSGGGSNSISVMFKEYGVRLNFKPTIVDEDHIRLEMEPEVSTIDFSNGVKFSGFLIPALKTRRAKTAVELRDGQSFALAGLLNNEELQSFSKIPVIAEVPLLGNLFKSKTFQKNETELMFIVTAQLVKPVNRDDLPQMRGIDGLKKGSPLGIEPKGEGIQGKTGFSISGQNNEGIVALAAKPDPKVESKPEAKPETKTATDATSEVTDSVPAVSTKTVNPTLPLARTIPPTAWPNIDPLKP